MRGVRFTKAEWDAVDNAVGLAIEAGDTAPTVRALVSARAKLEAARTAAVGPNAGSLERALIEGAGAHKVARLEGAGYARASKQAAALGATEEQLELVGRWVASQKWLTAVTLLSVLNKWAEWLPLARRVGAPQPRREGLHGGDDVGQAPAGGSAAAPRGRRPGFGG